MIKIKKYFTLIELIVVIAIIAVLAAVIAPMALQSIEKAKLSEAIANFKTYKTALQTFRIDVEDWPIGYGRDGHMNCLEDNGLLTNINTWPGWDGPYVENIKSMHPWKGVYCLQYANLGRGAAKEFYIEFNRCCFPAYTGSHGCDSDQCFVPAAPAQEIDRVFDNGNLATGNFFHEFPSVPDYLWMIEWDYL